jgi:O-antigen ligase
MLFRPANLGLFPVDRVAFLLLTFVVLLRTLLLHKEFPVSCSFTLPMLGLSALAVAGNWKHAYDAEMWSVVGAQFLVPFGMFHLARLVFTTHSAIRQLEIFCLLILAYLCFMSIAFLAGQSQLIFPRFILNDAVEMHLDRSRGPLLQAVANGVSLNLLGLVAFDLYRQRRVPRLVAGSLLLPLPIAIFAIMTRSVWLSFALSLVVIVLFGKRGRLWRLLLLGGLVAGTVVYAVSASSRVGTASQERLQDRETVDFRIAVYEASWDMFRENPLLGWGQGEFAHEIETRISDFRPGSYAAHNTFINILVEHGVVGLCLYLWIAVNLFRLGKRSRWLQFTWPICVVVYFVNACCVVMNYQFVNVLLFTFAGVTAFRNAAHAERLRLADTATPGT